MSWRDRYPVLSTLGEGGGGICYLVTDPRQPGSRYALKTLPKLKSDPKLLAAFVRECETLQKLHHPHLARLLEFGQGEDPFYLTEYVEGTDFVTAARDKDWNVVFSLIAQGCWALHDLHRLGLIHRDLKPDNVLVGKVHGSQSGRVHERWFLKIIDFGMALPQSQGTGQVPIGGALPYLAPEVLSRRPFDHRIDLYAWGLILYQMALGRLPFAGERRYAKYLEKLRTHQVDLSPLEKSGEIPEGFLKILSRLLAKDPEARLSDAQEAIVLLNEYENENFPLIWQAAQAITPSPASIPDLSHWNFDATPDEEVVQQLLEWVRQGHREGALEWVDKLAPRFIDNTDGELVQKFFGLGAHLLIQQGRFPEAASWIENLARHPALKEATNHEAMILQLQLAYREGRLKEGESLYQSHQTDFSQAPLERQTRWHNFGALVAQALHEFPVAAERFERAARSAEASGRRDHAASLQANAGTLYQEQGHWKKAFENFLSAQELARALENHSLLAHILSNLGNLYLYFGRMQEGNQAFSESVQIARSEGLKPLTVNGLFFLSIAEEARGNWERVEAQLEEAWNLAEGLEEAESKLQVLLARGYYALWRQRFEECSAIIRRLKETSQRSRQEHFRIQAIWLQAKLELAQEPGPGHPGFALPALKEVLQHAEEKNLKNMLWQVLADLGEWSLSQDYPDQAREYFLRALKTIEDLQLEVPEPFQKSFHRDRKKEKIRQKLENLAMETVPSPPLTGTPPQEVSATKTAAIPFERWMEINRRLLSQFDIQQLLEEILDLATDLTHAERGFVILSEIQSLDIKAARNLDKESLDTEEERFSRTLAKEVMRSGRAKLVLDVMGDEQYADIKSVHELSIRSALCVPLKAGARTLGLIYLDNRFRQGLFEEEHLPMMEALADQASLTLEHARLHAADQEKIGQLEKNQGLMEALNVRLEQDLNHTAQDLEAAREYLKRQSEAMGLKFKYENIIGKSDALKKVLKQVDRIAPSHANVLIVGESGTGKELIAQAIHFHSPRKERPFIAENCAAIAETLLESELFGHVRGAFTGAEKDKLGLFHMANGGTLFLDEVGEMSLSMQGKLLRALQEGEVRQVGGKEYRKVDVRVLTATNRDLKAMVKEGTFRQDLFYRLNVMQISLPPLRERVEDIPLLAQHFLQGSAEKESVRPPKLSKSAIKVLMDYSWPGNIREFQNEMQRLVIMGHPRIGPELLSPQVQQGLEAAVPNQVGRGGLDSLVAQVEKQAIAQALKRFRGNKLKVAKSLKIARCTLYDKLKKYRLAG